MTPTRSVRDSSEPNKKERAASPLLIKSNHEFKPQYTCFFGGFKRR